MRQTCPGVGPVILENRNVVHPMVQAQRVVALSVDAQDARHMRVREQHHIARMVRTVDDDLVKPEALNAPPEVLQAARRLHLARQRGKLVGDYAHGPRIAVRRVAQHLRRRLAFIAGTERTALDKLGYGLNHAMRGQFLRPLGPLGRDDDPFLGEKVLAKLGHVNPSSFSYRQMEGFLQSAGVRKWSSFRYLRRPAQALNTSLVIPTPERK